MLRTPLAAILDEEIQQGVTDFCRMLRWREDDYAEYPLFNFLELVMSQDPKLVSLDYLALPRILDRKMDTLRPPGFRALCQELKNGDTLEQHGGITLLSFLKTHFAYLRTKPKAPRAPAGADITTRTILQRRLNAGPWPSAVINPDVGNNL